MHSEATNLDLDDPKTGEFWFSLCWGSAVRMRNGSDFRVRSSIELVDNNTEMVVFALYVWVESNMSKTFYIINTSWHRENKMTVPLVKNRRICV